MFQTFETSASPEAGPARLAALRDVMAQAGLDGFLVPRADVHQGEYVAPCDARLAWLTGFTGSAGQAVVLRDMAGVFIDSRYRVQVLGQVADVFTPVPFPEVLTADWLREHLPDGGVLGFDPWLHAMGAVARLERDLGGSGIALRAVDNLVDRIWEDRPARPSALVHTQPEALTGRSSADKRAGLGAELAGAGQTAAVLTLPDSIAWLLNIRGRDIARNPVAQGFAVLYADARVDLFMDAAKLSGVDLGSEVLVLPPEGFSARLAALTGPVRIDPDHVPQAVAQILREADVVTVEARDPCILPKAIKTEAELAGARAAHQRDAVAMVEFLAWLDAQAPGSLTEVAVITALEGFRRAGNALRDISFETIAGTGAHGAIVHYRATHASNARIEDGHLLLVDSGGQYADGTTDITRTMAIGAVGDEERDSFTRVLRGMIGISLLCWPAGLAGRDMDAIARVPLWRAGLDYGHGTGHGVGSYLSVHEGPHGLSRRSAEPLQPGMILSNEPGFYRDGAYGIRLENLIAVRQADLPDGATIKELLCFETLSYVPFDRRLIVADMLDGSERDWLNAYHAECRSRVEPHVSPAAADWLRHATQPI